ncbi:MAG: hypothetical protein ACRDIW_10250, partial [Actinomycetota bacterium]
MPSPRFRRAVRRTLAMGIVAGAVLGLFPPALGSDVPPTVVRRVSLEEDTLLPPRSATSLRPGGA